MKKEKHSKNGGKPTKVDPNPKDEKTLDTEAVKQDLNNCKD